MIIQEEVKKQRDLLDNIDFLRYYAENSTRFSKFNGYRDNCSRTVKKYLSLLGLETPTLTAWADTVRTLGTVEYNPAFLQPGDIVAMGRPGDTWHVGVYMGDGRVLHQSRSRGYTVGVYNDLHAFINHRVGFYYIRPNYAPIQSEVVEDLIANPQPLVAPSIGG